MTSGSFAEDKNDLNEWKRVRASMLIFDGCARVGEPEMNTGSKREPELDFKDWPSDFVGFF